MTQINFNIDSFEASFAYLTAVALQEPAAELGGIIKDCISECRLYMNEILKKWCNKRNSRNFDSQNMHISDPKFIISWCRAAMLESNETLQEIWANLLVNAEDKNFTDEIRIAFIDIIKTLTPIEVKILEHAYNNKKDRETTINSKEIESELKINHLSFEAALNNLERCQLLYSFDRDDNGFITKDFTALGLMFVRACIN